MSRYIIIFILLTGLFSCKKEFSSDSEIKVYVYTSIEQQKVFVDIDSFHSTTVDGNNCNFEIWIYENNKRTLVKSSKRVFLTYSFPISDYNCPKGYVRVDVQIDEYLYPKYFINK